MDFELLIFRRYVDLVDGVITHVQLNLHFLYAIYGVNESFDGNIPLIESSTIEGFPYQYFEVDYADR